MCDWIFTDFSGNRSLITTFTMVYQYSCPDQIESSSRTYAVWSNFIANLNFFQWLFQPIQDLGLFFTHIRTTWTSDQFIARPLPTHKTTQSQNKRIHTPKIHDLSGIRTHNTSVRASEDSLCLRPRV
jgi:hypothetical protein